MACASTPAQRPGQSKIFQEEVLPSYLAEGVLNHLSDLRGFDAVRNVEMRRGFVCNAMVVPDGASNLFRNAHGGFTLAEVDIAACMAAYTLGKRVVTLQCNCNFMAPVRIGDEVRVEGTVLHDGATTVVARVDVLDSTGQVCVTATVTMYVVAGIAPDDPVPQPYLPRCEVNSCE